MATRRSRARRGISDSIVHWATSTPTLECPLESCRSETSPPRRSSPFHARTPQGRRKSRTPSPSECGGCCCSVSARLIERNNERSWQPIHLFLTWDALVIFALRNQRSFGKSLQLHLARRSFYAARLGFFFKQPEIFLKYIRRDGVSMGRLFFCTDLSRFFFLPNVSNWNSNTSKLEFHLSEFIRSYLADVRQFCLLLLSVY